MWKTERKRWDASHLRHPGTNDVGKRRKPCTFFFSSPRDHFQTTHVALGCMRLTQFPVCTGLRESGASLSDLALKKFHFAADWSVVGHARRTGRSSAVSQYVNISLVAVFPLHLLWCKTTYRNLKMVMETTTPNTAQVVCWCKPIKVGLTRGWSWKRNRT